MNRAVLIGAALALLLLAAFYYFIDIRGREAAQESESAALRLVTCFDHQQVRAVTIEAGGGAAIRVARVGADSPWQVTAPESAAADPDVIQQLLDTLGRLSAAEEPFRPGDDGLAPYGLNPPQLSVTVEGEDRNLLARLAVGGPAPFGASRYAAVRETGEVGLVGASEIDAVPDTAFDLREKRLVRFRREDVQELRLEAMEKPRVVIRRLGGNWEIAEPLAFAANRELVGNLLWELSEVRALEFPVDETVPGSDGSPVYRVGLGLADGEEIEIRLGEPAGTGDTVKAIGGSGIVMRVEAAILEAVRRPANQWRELRPFPRYDWEVDGLTVTRAGIDPVRWLQGEDGIWRKDGGMPQEETAAETIDRALELLTGLEACSLIGLDQVDLESLALDPPACAITLTGGSEPDLTTDSLEIGFPGAPLGSVSGGCDEMEPQVCGIRPGGDWIYVINEPERDELRAVLETLSAGGLSGNGQGGE